MIKCSTNLALYRFSSAHLINSIILEHSCKIPYLKCYISDVPCPSWENLEGVLKAAKTVVEGLVTFLQNSGHKKHDFLTPFNNVRYKTSMCRDFAEKGNCPRGSSCTFAHSEEELER